jgi:hypothetical protein
MTHHAHDGGRLVNRPVDYDYVVHHQRADAGLLTVAGVPAAVCDLCDEYWFDDAVGFALSRLLTEHRPDPGEIRSIQWPHAHAA